MPVSEAQLRAIKKYDEEKMATVTCRVSRQKADLFTAACRDLGTTKYAVFKDAIEDTIAKAEKMHRER